MARAPERIFIKPATVNPVGRGARLANVPYPPTAGTPRKVLPPEGATVTMEGAAGSYWQRRINEGSVEKVEPPQVEQPKVSITGTTPKTRAPEPGKKDGKD